MLLCPGPAAPKSSGKRIMLIEKRAARAKRTAPVIMLYLLDAFIVPLSEKQRNFLALKTIYFLLLFYLIFVV